MRTLVLVALTSLLSLGCGSSSGGTGGGSGGGTGGGSAGGAGGGSGGGAAGGAGGGSGHQVNAATACPHVVLNSALPVTYQGDTSTVPDWVTSTRLEWKEAPDDSLRF